METEMGPCAEFSLYHLMDLERGEQHLVTEDKISALTTNANRILRGCAETIGKGYLKISSASFGVGLAQLTDNLPPASQKLAAHEVMDPSMAPKPVPVPKTFSDICRILCSKNAGPYEITPDAIFFSEAEYRYSKESGFLSSTNVANALGILKEDIIWIGFYDPALAFKVTIPRVRAGKRKCAGGFMENDVHGSQEYLGLAGLPLPGSGAPAPGLALSFTGRGWKRLMAFVAMLWSMPDASALQREVETMNN